MIEALRPLPQTPPTSLLIYGLGITFTFGCTFTPPPPAAFGAYMLLVPVWDVKVSFQPPLMVTVPVVLLVGTSL